MPLRVFNIQDLPNEILGQVIEAAPKATRLALLQVSPLFAQLALREVYKTVEFHELSQIGSLYETIARYPCRAELIKRLIVQLYVEPREYRIASPPLNQIIEILRNLEVLHINVHTITADTTESIIRSCNSPNLRELTCYSTPLSASALADVFACRHAQNLTVLRLSMQTSASNVPLYFPSLREFSGPAEIFCQLAGGMMHLVSAHLSWAYSRDPDYEIHVATIERNCAQTLRSFSCFVHGSGENVMEVVSRRLPKLQHLAITYDQPLSVPPTEELEKMMLTCLGQLQSLMAFSYASHWRSEPGSRPTSKLLVRLGERCPSLQKCRLYESFWERHGEYHWSEQHER